MATSSFTLKVFSGRGLEIEEMVRSVNVPSQVGELGFLPNHCEYVGLLAAGIVDFYPDATGKRERCIVAGGVCTFRDNVLTLLADSVDLPTTIDTATYASGLTELKVKRDQLSLNDPEWAVVNEEINRISAISTLLSASNPS
jgi:F0F1-type ATP synthase epsilon subunit